VSWTPAGQVTFTPTAQMSGHLRLIYTVADDHGATAQEAIHLEIRPRSQPPQANDDAYLLFTQGQEAAGGPGVRSSGEIHHGAALRLRPLENDYAPPDAQLQIVAVSQARHGEVTLDRDGTLSYTPAPGLRGVDRITYTAANLQQPGLTAQAQIHIAVDPLPIGVPDHHLETLEDQPLTTPILAPGTALLGIGPTQGQVLPLADGRIHYTPPLNFHGVEEFVYIAGHGEEAGQGRVRITVHGVNDPPMAQDDRFSLHENHSLDMIVAETILANDWDPEGEALQLVGVGQPRFGQVAEVQPGSLRYTPPPGFAGLDRFFYTVADPQGSRASAQVTLLVLPLGTPPQVALSRWVAQAGLPLSLDLLSQATGGPGLRISQVTPPAHGHIEMPAPDRVIYTPGPEQRGAVTILFTVEDEAGRSGQGQAEIWVRGSNRQPLIDPIPDQESALGEEVHLPVGVMDPDGDRVILSAAGIPPGIRWEGDGFQGRATQSGSYPVTLSARDGEALSQATFHWQITDEAGGQVGATGTERLYLPLLIRAPDRPDLVGQVSRQEGGEGIHFVVTVSNQGQAASGPFWVDLYAQPSQIPQPGQAWASLCGVNPCYGAAWQIPGLAPGQSVTLFTQQADPAQSLWPGSLPPEVARIYLLVDSWGADGGMVVEGDESNNLSAIEMP
jgi:hypothetical protein